MEHNFFIRVQFGVEVCKLVKKSGSEILGYDIILFLKVLNTSFFYIYVFLTSE